MLVTEMHSQDMWKEHVMPRQHPDIVSYFLLLRRLISTTIRIIINKISCILRIVGQHK